MHLIVFAKEPVPGRVKTRLASVLGADEAAILHRTLTGRTLRVAADAAPDVLELCCTPDHVHPILTALAGGTGARLTAQGVGNLGERMARAVERVLASGVPVVIVGTDCPVLSTTYLNQAGQALAGGADAVLGPAEDGGYVLIGLRRYAPGLFDDIRWGGVEVCDAQRHRLTQAGFRCAELPVLWDVDRPADLDRYRAHLRDSRSPEDP
jgi:rSAM/selenodomain-associated transferase 1